MEEPIFKRDKNGNLIVSDTNKLQQQVAKVNNNYITPSTSRVDANAGITPTTTVAEGLAKVKADSGSTWYPMEGYDAFQQRVLKAEYNVAKKKADDQGFFGELGGFLAQGVVGEILLGTISGAGYLLDLDHWFDKASGGEGDWGNWLSDLAESGQEGMRELTPIYLDPSKQGQGITKSMTDSAWWFSNGVSVASGLSMLIPVAGGARALGMAGKGLGMLGKTAKIAGRAGKFGKAGTKAVNLLDEAVTATPKLAKILGNNSSAITKAVLSRHLENHMEAAQVFKEKYEELKAKGVSEEEARHAASEGASLTYTANWPMILQDIPQYLMLGRGFKAAQDITESKFLKATGGKLSGVQKFLKYSKTALPLATEGFEELYQYMASEEGKHLADVKAGIVKAEDSTLSDRVGGYLKDSEAWTSALFGAIGGGLFNVAEPVAQKISEKVLKGNRISAVDARINEHVQRQAEIIANVQAYNEAVEAGNPMGVEVAKARMAFNIGVNSAKVGNWGLAKSHLETLKDVSPADKKEYNLDREFSINMDSWIKDTERVVELYSANMDKYADSTVESITYRQYMLERFNKALPTQKAELDKLIQSTPLVNNLTAEGKQAFDNKVAIAGLERFIKSTEVQTKLNKGTEAETEYRTKQADHAKVLLDVLKQKDKEYTSGLTSEQDKEILSSVSGGFLEDLGKARGEIDMLEGHIKAYTNELNHLTSREAQKAYKDKVIQDQEKAAFQETKRKNEVKDKVANDKLNGNLSVEEETELMSTVDSSEEMSIADLNTKLSNNEIAWTDLPPKLQEDIKKYRESLVTEEEEFPMDEEGAFSYGEEFERDPYQDHQTSENNGFTEDAETPENPEDRAAWRVGDDSEVTTITGKINGLAWLSVNNSLAGKEVKTKENVALTEFLEKEPSLDGISVRFDINSEWFEKNKSDKIYKGILEDLMEGKVPNRKPGKLGSGEGAIEVSSIGYVPIKASLYKDGKPVVYNGVELSMSLRETDSYFSEGGTVPKHDNYVAQVQSLEAVKTQIIEAYLKGITLQAELTGKTNGNLNVVQKEEGGYAKNNLAQVLKKNGGNIEFVYGSSGAGIITQFLDSKGEPVKSLGHLSTPTPGSIYAMTFTSNGTPFPLRAQVEKLGKDEASLLYMLYNELLADKANISAGLSDKVISRIETHPNPVISGLASYLNLNTITMEELLNHLVYEGKKTDSKAESRLYATLSTGEMRFGIYKMSKEQFASANGKDAFIKHITENRRRQISVKRLGDANYKRYLVENNILTTNAALTSTGSLFVQPVVMYSTNLTPVESSKEISVGKELSVAARNKIVKLGVPAEAIDKMTPEDVDTAKKIMDKADAVELVEKYTPKVEDYEVIEESEPSNVTNKTKEDSIKVAQQNLIKEKNNISIERYSPTGRFEERINHDENIVLEVEDAISANVAFKPFSKEKTIDIVNEILDLFYPALTKKHIESLILKYKYDSSSEVFDFIIKALDDLNNRYNAELTALDKSTISTSENTFEEESAFTYELPADFVMETPMDKVDEVIDSKAEEEAKLAEARKEAMLKRVRDRRSKGDTGAFSLFKGEGKFNVNLNSELETLKSILPKEIATELHDDYINTLNQGIKATGLFRNGMITISKYAPSGVAYHEGFHAVFRTLLASKEQITLLKEAEQTFTLPSEEELEKLSSVTGITNEAELKNLYYEEQLADAFADYMKSFSGSLSSYPTGIKGFFQRLLSWIKNVFSDTNKVDALFNHIATGKYKNKAPRITRKVAYSTAMPAGFSVNQVQEVTRQLVYAAFSKVTSIDTIDQIDFENITVTLEEQAATALEMEDTVTGEAIYDRLMGIMDESGNLTAFWRNQVTSYIEDVIGLKKVKEKGGRKEDTEDLDSEEMEELEKNNFLKSSYEVSGKVNASATVKFLVAMVPKIEKYQDGKAIYKRSTFTGLPEFNDYSTTWNSLEELLPGIVGIYGPDGTYTNALTLMKEKLRVEAKYKPEMQFIADRLEALDENSQVQFHFTFSRQKGNYIDHVLTKDDNGVRSKLLGADIESKEKIIREQWAANFTELFGEHTDAGLVYSTSQIVKVLRYQERLNQLILNDTKNKKFTLTSNNEPALLVGFKGILRELGVTIDDYVLAKLIDDQGMVRDENFPDNYAITALKGLVIKLNASLTGLKEKAGKKLDVNTNQIADQSFFKVVLARTQGYFSKVAGERTFNGPEGNKIWMVQDNNLMSKTLSQLKTGDNRHIDRLKQSSYHQNSRLLNKMINDPYFVNSMEIGLYGNFRVENEGDKGNKAADLKPAEQFLDVITKTLDGIYVGLAEADKSQQSYLVVGKEMLVKSGIKRNEAGKFVFDNTRSEVTTIFMNYLADELNRMRTAHKQYYGYTDSYGVEHKPLDEKDQLLYYHYVLDKNGVRHPGNAFHSFLFPNIDLVKLGLQNPSVGGELGTIKPLTKENFNDNPQLKDYIEQAILERVEYEYYKAESMGVLPLLDSTPDTGLVASRGGDLSRTMADYTVNALIGNIEQIKLFNQDPALYKVKIKFTKDEATGKFTMNPWNTQDHFGDFMKRIPAVSASGKDMCILEDMNLYYSSAVINNIDNVPSEYFTNPENLKNIANITGTDLGKVTKLFAPYAEVNQTDAQAWITLRAYRERMLGFGKWTPYHEAAYVKTVKGETLNFKEIKLLAQPLKTVHVENVLLNGVMTVQYNKQSEAVLLPEMVKGIELENLLQAMEDQAVDHVIVLDGKKVGAKGMTKVVNENNRLLPSSEIVLNKDSLHYDFLFLQQDLSSKGVKNTLVGSQTVKNELGVISLDEVYLDGLTGMQFLNEYHTTIADLSDIGLKNAQMKLGFSDGRFTSKDGISSLRKFLYKEFKADFSDNHLRALLEDFDLDAFPNNEQLRNKLNSVITKSAVKLEQLGGAFVQLSNLGFVGVEISLKDQAVKDGIIWLKNPKEQLQPMRFEGRDVKPTQILLPHKELLKMIEAKGKLNGKSIESYKDLTSEQIRELIDVSALEGLSYRIPNQGPSSNDAFEIVGFLPPEMGDTIVSYGEITVKTGSDFDIDKAYIILPNFHYNKDTNKIEAIKYDPDHKTEKGLQNYRLTLMRAALTHPSAFLEVMAPLDDPRLEKLVKSMYPEEVVTKNLGFFSGLTQMTNKATFDSAKNLVGTIANHMTHNSAALNEKLYFKGYYLGKGKKTEVTSTEVQNKSVTLTTDDWNKIIEKDSEMTKEIWDSIPSVEQSKILECL